LIGPANTITESADRRGALSPVAPSARRSFRNKWIAVEWSRSAVCRSSGDTSRDYAPGTVRRMRYAEIAALLHVVEDTVFDIYVFRSYADYAWDFLLATARAPAKVSLFGAQNIPI